jgi:AICAR transformylase/IMP cyclohydrolase PurH (only IMP cyclohydrolase domain in Aful)
MKKVERALISVSKKEGIGKFARELNEFGIEIYPPAVRQN